jgi:hypothetical protein
MAGPRTRQKLQPRSTQAIANAARSGSGIGSLDIDRAWSQHGPGHGNLPDTYKGPLDNNPNYLGEPIHNTLFNINRNAPNLKWLQNPMDKGTHPFVEFYPGQPRNYFPPFVPKEEKGTSFNIMTQMDELRKMGEIDFLGNLDQVWGGETPGRQMEGIPQDYSHITDYYDYLNTLPVDQLQGIESLMEAKRMNAARNKKWWAQSDI